jgi:hypothetical protein
LLHNKNTNQDSAYKYSLHVFDREQKKRIGAQFLTIIVKATARHLPGGVGDEHGFDEAAAALEHRQRVGLELEL